MLKYYEDNSNITNLNEHTDVVNAYNRILYLDTSIDDNIVSDLCRHIINYNNDDCNMPVKKRKTITLYIDSLGGSTYGTQTLVSCIQASITPIRAIVIGKCFSNAIYVLVACHRRYALPNTMFLIHCGSFGIDTTTAMVAYDTVNFYRKLDNNFIKFLESKTNLLYDDIKLSERSENYMFAEDALRYGIIDSIKNKL